MVAFADLVLPDTTYLERHDCISLLDRPISEPDAAADAIRWPVVEPDRDVRPLPVGAARPRRTACSLPGMAEPDGSPTYRDYADYMIRHQRRPGVGPLAGWRGDGSAEGRGAPNPDQLDALHRERRLLDRRTSPRRPPTSSRGTPPTRTGRCAIGLLRRARSPTSSSSTPSRSRRFQAAALGKGDAPAAGRTCATASPAPWRRCRSGIRRAPTTASTRDAFPLHAITQRPAAMYHSWGSQNAWLRQIHGENPLYVPGPVWEALGFEDGDWADVVSPHGRITVPVARMDAQNPLHRLDLERHRQAPRRLGARPRRARRPPAASCSTT